MPNQINSKSIKNNIEIQFKYIIEKFKAGNKILESSFDVVIDQIKTYFTTITTPNNFSRFLKMLKNELTSLTEIDPTLSTVFLNAIQTYVNSNLKPLKNKFVTKNRFNETDVSDVNIDVEKFREYFYKSIENLPIESYIPKESFLKLIKNMEDDDIKKLYKFLEQERLKNLEYYSSLEAKKIYDEKFIKNIIKVFNKNILESPDPFAVLLYQENLLTQAEFSFLGRKYNHLNVNLNNPNKQRETEERKTIDEKINEIAFFKNLLIYFNTDVMCWYNNYIDTSLNPFLFQEDINHFNIENIINHLKTLDTPLRFNQLECCLPESGYKYHANNRKYKVGEFSKAGIATWEIYTDKLKYNIYILEHLKNLKSNDNEIILYVLPNRDPKYIQQLSRLDYVKNFNNTLVHKDSGSEKLIKSKAHLQDYNVYDIICHDVNIDGSPTKKPKGNFMPNATLYDELAKDEKGLLKIFKSHMNIFSTSPCRFY